MSWTIDSWRAKTARQQPEYPDPIALQRSIDRLHTLPPLVTSWEIEHLRSLLSAAAEGRGFLLQGGDCSEQIDECSTESIVRQLKILMQMGLVMEYVGRRPVVRLGRIAGQYAKPRSDALETRDGVSLPVYRGDIINRSGFSLNDRQADPELLIRGYERAALTLNFIRALASHGFADVHHPENWDLAFAQDSPYRDKYQEIVASITHALQFVEMVLDRPLMDHRGVELFTSHEGLHLVYEQAQTRRVPRRDGWYNLSTHFPWIGNRTRQLDGAHIEYFRGIQNPLGIKIDGTIDDGELERLLQALNPHNQAGRITLIHRMGVDRLCEHLPRLIEVVRRGAWKVLWCCDPMHGNTYTTPAGQKTRDCSKILGELKAAFEIHRAHGSRLGGVHLELTGENVTECLGGSRGVREEDLAKNYKSTVDPRLNYDQAMEIAFLIAEQMALDTNPPPGHQVGGVGR